MDVVTNIVNWFSEALDREIPAWGRALRVTVLLLLASTLVAVPAHAGIIEDAVKDGTQGMIDGIVRRVNYMAQATIPTSFEGLLAGQGSAHVYAKAAQMYGSGVARSIASTLLALVMLVQLVKISQRTEAHATFPAVREVCALLVACAIYTYLVGHAWDLMNALFTDLSSIWSSWGSEPATHVSSMNIDDKNGLAVLLPMLVSALICSILVDVATIISMVVVWGRGMQLYFMATMSPIPLALLGIDETRQMGVGFLVHRHELRDGRRRRDDPLHHCGMHPGDHPHREVRRLGARRARGISWLIRLIWLTCPIHVRRLTKVGQAIPPSAACPQLRSCQLVLECRNRYE